MPSPSHGVTYRGFLDRLPSTVHGYAPTQRGHGEADRPGDGYRVHDYAEDLVEFMDAVGLDRAVVVGTSSGGLVSQMVASHHPERVAALMLVSSPASLADKPGVVEIAAEFDALEDPIDRGYVETFVRKTSPQSISEDELVRLVEESLKTPARVWKESMRGLLDPTLHIDLERISAPTVVVSGSGDSLVAADQQLLVEEIRDARLVVFEGIGHSLHLALPELVVAELNLLIDRVRPPA